MTTTTTSSPAGPAAPPAHDPRAAGNGPGDSRPPDRPGPQPQVTYLLWSQKHQAWWKPYAWGYTTDTEQAGQFTEADAVRYVVASAQCGDPNQVTFMVAAPGNWLAAR